MKDKLIELFGESWFTILQDYLLSKEFLELGANINQLRKSKTIYPSSDKVFRIFKEVPYENINIIFLGLDPYTDGSACGHSFCNCEAIKPSKSLKFIMQEIEQEYPELTDRFEMPFGGVDKWDLRYLTKQGVFLYNTALTVEKGKTESHLDLWKSFTQKVIEALNKHEYLVWILLGKKAQSFESIINPKHSIVKTDHPSYHNYSPDAKFLGSGIFRQCNYELDKHGKLEIQW